MTADELGTAIERAREAELLKAENGGLVEELTDAREQIVLLVSDQAALRQRIEDQRRELHATRVELASAHQTLAATSARLAAAAGQLATTSAQLSSVLGSRTWTLTAPVRRVLGRSR